MQAHPTDRPLLAKASSAIADLLATGASADAPPTSTLLSIGACELLCTALTVACFSPGARGGQEEEVDREVLRQALRAVGEVALEGEEALSALVEAGACEAMCTVLAGPHAGDAEACASAFAGVARLACDAGGYERLVDYGACEAVCAAWHGLGAVQSVDVAQSACEAVGNLAVREEVAAKLAEAGACALLCAALRDFAGDVEVQRRGWVNESLNDQGR
jgi:hypothetical protein